MSLNPKVDKYLLDGCMRCKFGGTPRCKVNTWREELETLRQIVLDATLTEELKWSVPVYTHKGKNIVSINALKDSANLVFFKGVLLSDPQKIMQQQGNQQAFRLLKFTSVSDILNLKQTLQAYIKEAVALEESGRKVEFKRSPEPIPDELIQMFEREPEFKKAFFALTPGRQRGYILYFSQAKQSQTRIARIEKYKMKIFNGLGWNDRG